MSGFIWPSSKTFEIVLIYKLYKYIYMKYHNSLYKHESISLFLVCIIPAGLVVTFVKCMYGIY